MYLQFISLKMMIRANNLSLHSINSKPATYLSGLHKIPQQIRFPMAGAINTVNFMVWLILGNKFLKGVFPPATIYSIVSIITLPIGHAVTSLVVFGWPKPYFSNLLMNLPIGMSGTVVGTFSTETLIRMEFDAKVRGLLQMLNLVGKSQEEDDGTGFTNIMVMIVTGIWGYVLSVMVNSKPQKKGDKEL